MRQRQRLSVLATRPEKPEAVTASADAPWLALARHTLPFSPPAGRCFLLMKLTCRLTFHEDTAILSRRSLTWCEAHSSIRITPKGPIHVGEAHCRRKQKGTPMIQNSYNANVPFCRAEVIGGGQSGVNVGAKPSFSSAATVLCRELANFRHGCA